MKRRLSVYAPLSFLAIVLVLSASCATAPWGDINDISADELKGMLDREEDVLVVDTRTEYEYRQGRIPGAILITPHQFSKLDTLLPPRKDMFLVFYCRGTG